MSCLQEEEGDSLHHSTSPLCRAQGELPAGQDGLKGPYEREPMPKGRAGPVAGRMQAPQAPAQQYYQQVNGLWQ